MKKLSTRTKTMVYKKNNLSILIYRTKSSVLNSKEYDTFQALEMRLVEEVEGDMQG